MKIRQITIQNYRAFYQDYTIAVADKNLLVYGENGSGKSSLYKALEDLFFASNSRKSIEANIFNAPLPNPPAPFVEIQFNNIPSSIYRYVTDSTTPQDNTVLNIQKHNPFFTYKRLLRTYLAEKDGEKPNLFDLIIDTIIPNLPNRASGKTFGEEWTEIKRVLKHKKKYRTTVTTQLNSFNNGLNNFLTDLSQRVNTLLNTYFHHQVSIAFEFVPIALVRGRNLDNKKITVNATYANQSTGNTPYNEFLNEARLSAFALCMYLASLKIVPEPPQYKLLLLDDVFIGLDMSNRLPLLEILKAEFADYQIVMTTYDRAWFEVAKDWFAQKMRNQWKMIEMYVDNVTHAFDIPVVLETQTHIEKAEHYLAKHDYPACGMYLRKECERVLNYLLKPAYRIMQTPLDNKTQNYATDVKKLNDMILALRDFCQEEGIDYTPFEELGIYKDAVLNPLAHNDITNPIFKEELISIISILKKLEQIRIIEIPDTKGKDLILELQANIYSVEFRPTEPILCILEPHQPLRLMNKNKNTKLSVNRNGTKTSIKQEFDTIQLLYREACQDFGVPETHNLFDIIKKRGQTLQDLINAIP